MFIFVHLSFSLLMQSTYPNEEPFSRTGFLNSDTTEKNWKSVRTKIRLTWNFVTGSVDCVFWVVFLWAYSDQLRDTDLQPLNWQRFTKLLNYYRSFYKYFIVVLIVTLMKRTGYHRFLNFISFSFKQKRMKGSHFTHQISKTFSGSSWKYDAEKARNRYYNILRTII